MIAIGGGGYVPARILRYDVGILCLLFSFRVLSIVLVRCLSLACEWRLLCQFAIALSVDHHDSSFCGQDAVRNERKTYIVWKERSTIT